MSQQGPGVLGLPLFAPPVPEHVRAIHERMEDAHSEFIHKLRTHLFYWYGDGQEAISTDDAWRVMQEVGLLFPDGASPNLMGSLFSGWNRATPVGWTRSKRAGSHANLLRTWRVT